MGAEKQSGAVEIVTGIAGPQDTRGRILDAARLLFGDRGYEATSVNEVVERAGLTKGAFYHHFSSKAGVFLEIDAEYVEAQIHSLSTVLNADCPDEERLSAAVQVLFMNVVKYRANVLVLMQPLPHLPAEVEAAVRGRRDLLESLLVRVLDGFFEARRSVAPLPSNVLAYGVLGMCAWSAHWFLSDGALSAEDIAAGYAEIVVRGVVGLEERWT